MTRKRFWRLRNAENVRLREWAKDNLGGCPSGVSDKTLRPVSGKPLVDFREGVRLGFGSSYKEVWESSGNKALRGGLGL